MADIDLLIKVGFEVFVNETFKKDDIRKFLLNHERKGLFQENLLREVKKSFHVIKNRSTIKTLINNMSSMFCRAALEVKEKELDPSFTQTMFKSDVEC